MCQQSVLQYNTFFFKKVTQGVVGIAGSVASLSTSENLTWTCFAGVMIFGISSSLLSPSPNVIFNLSRKICIP